MELNQPNGSDRTLPGAGEPSERIGAVIRTGLNEYKLIDPRTGGVYIVNTERPWTDEKIIRHINVFVRKNGRAPAGETLTIQPKQQRM